MTQREEWDRAEEIIGEWLRDLEDSERKPSTIKGIAYWLLCITIVFALFAAVAE